MRPIVHVAHPVHVHFLPPSPLKYKILNPHVASGWGGDPPLKFTLSRRYPFPTCLRPSQKLKKKKKMKRKIEGIGVLRYTPLQSLSDNHKKKYSQPATFR